MKRMLMFQDLEYPIEFTRIHGKRYLKVNMICKDNMVDISINNSSEEESNLSVGFIYKGWIPTTLEDNDIMHTIEISLTNNTEETLYVSFVKNNITSNYNRPTSAIVLVDKKDNWYSEKYTIEPTETMKNRISI